MVPAFKRMTRCCRHGVQLLREFASLEPGTPTVLLVSLKAGGVGLNLTSASHVHLLEPFWNPASASPRLLCFFLQMLWLQVVCIVCPRAAALQASASVLLALGGTLAVLMRLWCAQHPGGQCIAFRAGKQLQRGVSFLHYCGVTSLMSSVYNPVGRAVWHARCGWVGRLDCARHAHAAAPQ